MTLVATMWQTLVSDATAAGNTGSRTFAGCCDNRRAETNWLPSLPLERIIMVQRAMWNGLPCRSEGLCWNQRFILSVDEFTNSLANFRRFLTFRSPHQMISATEVGWKERLQICVFHVQLQSRENQISVQPRQRATVRWLPCPTSSGLKAYYV